MVSSSTTGEKGGYVRLYGKERKPHITLLGEARGKPCQAELCHFAEFFGRQQLLEMPKTSTAVVKSISIAIRKVGLLFRQR